MCVCVCVCVCVCEQAHHLYVSFTPTLLKPATMIVVVVFMCINHTYIVAVMSQFFSSQYSQ